MSLDDLLSIANASGFLLQLRVESEARASSSKHGWELVGTEYPWNLPRTGDSGFIDLLLQAGALRLVIECKRPKQGKWVFLVPESEHKARPLDRLRWTHRLPGAEDLAGFHRFSIKPQSDVSSFCAVRGAGENDQPMLERLAHKLLLATEAQSLQELEAALRVGMLAGLVVYLPIIVTSAELFTCSFPVDQVTLSDGTLPAANFEKVPFIRFEKSFLLETVEERSMKTLSAIYQEAVATLFVVNAEGFGAFLAECELIGSPDAHENPWVGLRANIG